MRSITSTRRPPLARRSTRAACVVRHRRTAFRYGFRAMERQPAACTLRRSADSTRHKFFPLQTMFGLSTSSPISFTEHRAQEPSSTSLPLARVCPPRQDKRQRRFLECPQSLVQARTRLPSWIVRPQSRDSIRCTSPTIEHSPTLAASSDGCTMGFPGQTISTSVMAHLAFADLPQRSKDQACASLRRRLKRRRTASCRSTTNPGFLRRSCPSGHLQRIRRIAAWRLPPSNLAPASKRA